MRTKTVLAALTALVASAGAAHAATTLTSAAIPTGVNNTTACYFRNVGTTPISLQAQGLINFLGGFTTPNFENCNEAPLGDFTASRIQLGRLTSCFSFRLHSAAQQEAFSCH